MTGAKGSGDVQRASQCHAILQGTQRRRLNGRAVSHRIGKGHAEFDNINIRVDKGIEDAGRGLRIRIAGSYKNTQNATIFSACIGKGIGNSRCHRSTLPVMVFQADIPGRYFWQIFLNDLSVWRASSRPTAGHVLPIQAVQRPNPCHPVRTY